MTQKLKKIIFKCKNTNAVVNKNAGETAKRPKIIFEIML